MAKAKVKKPAQLSVRQTLELIEKRFAVLIEDERNNALAIMRLEEAICPRVAARLTALERQQTALNVDVKLEDRIRALELKSNPFSPAIHAARPEATPFFKSVESRKVLTVGQVISAAKFLHELLGEGGWNKQPFKIRNEQMKLAGQIIRKIEEIRA